MSEPSTSTALTKGTAALTYGSAGTAVAFGLTANELAAFAGVAVAVLMGFANLALNAYFKWQRLKLDRETAGSRPDCAVCPERES